MASDGHFCVVGKCLWNKLIKTEQDKRLIYFFYRGILLVCLSVPLYWNGAAILLDFDKLYSPGRSLFQFIENNGMEEMSIFSTWTAGGSVFPESEGKDDYIVTTLCHTGVELSAYYPHNMVINLTDGDDRFAYSIHRRVSYAENEEAKSHWRAKGLPDLIIGKMNLEAAYGNLLDYTDYVLVEIIDVDSVWKNHYRSSKLPIFLRKDLIDKYNLEPVTGVKAASIMGFSITDEMIETIKNGTPAEEVLKPYLDQMFGEEK